MVGRIQVHQQELDMIILKDAVCLPFNKKENEAFSYADEQAEEAFFSLVHQCYDVLDLREKPSQPMAGGDWHFSTERKI